MRKLPESDLEQILELPEYIQDQVLLKGEHFDADKWDKYLADKESGRK
jgi:hypothetical protein